MLDIYQQIEAYKANILHSMLHTKNASNGRPHPPII